MARVRQSLQTRFGRRKVPLAVEQLQGKLIPSKAFPAGVARAEAQLMALGHLMKSNTPFAVSITPTKARLTGVGFFDRVHGQNGGAPNGIELHPILCIEFL
jgi:hypothetical protein